MSLAIAGKVVGGLVLGGASAVGIGYIIYDALQDKRLAFFVESTDISSDTSKITSAKTLDANNHKCKFENKNEFDCTITAVSFSTTNKHSYISALTNNIDANLLTTTELQKKGNFYKVIVNNSDDLTKLDDTKDEFELISKVTNETNKKFAKFKKLFAMNGKAVNYKYTKRQYFVVKGTEKTAISVDSANTKCSFNDNDATITNSCKVYDFGTKTGTSADLKEWTFVGTNETTSISQGNYYFIDLQKDIKDEKQYENMFIKKGSEEKKTLTNVMTAIQFEGSDSNKNHLFILN